MTHRRPQHTIPRNSYEVQEESEAKEKDEESSISVCCALTTTSTVRVNHMVHYASKPLLLPSLRQQCPTHAFPESSSQE